MDGVENDVATAFTIVGLVVLGLIVFLISRKGGAPDQRPAAPRPATAGPTTNFHAVSIKVGSNVCSAAQSLEGKRFLSNAAPRIPLPDCDVPECECRFEHHGDRREPDTDDRRNPYRAGMGAETGQFQAEKREGLPDRRGNRPTKI